MMRRRKRGYGSYVDEDTGEVTAVQTTKQAKRNHQKSGKWYKEPTEREIRAWDREEQRQAAVDRAARRQQNKKINAVKRNEQAAKEQALKRQLFDAGKITFTQTLAKKDEDQRNLHSWFGGRPVHNGDVKPLETTAPANVSAKDEVKHANRGVTTSRTAYGLNNMNGDRTLSQHSLTDQASIQNGMHHCQSSQRLLSTKQALSAKMDRKAELTTMDHLPDPELGLLNSTQDFDIVEDSEAEAEILEFNVEQADQESYKQFKVPALPDRPARLPLSPMSQSEVNIRAADSLHVSGFREKLAKADTPTATTSSQTVLDILAGISTQDLVDDLDDEAADDKENVEPDAPLEKDGPLRKLQRSSPWKSVGAVERPAPSQSFGAAESPNYDDILAELDAADETDASEDFDDGGLDDATLLSLPVTQLVAQTPGHLPFSVTKARSAPHSAPAKPTRTRESLKKCDSFAIEGLDDEDLLEGLEQYERSQKMDTPAAMPTKKRVLPWEKQDWTGPQNIGGKDDGTEIGEIAQELSFWNKELKSLDAS